MTPAKPPLRAWPGLCVAGKVNIADKLYLVIELVRLDTSHAQCSSVPVPADGAGGLPLGLNHGAGKKLQLKTVCSPPRSRPHVPAPEKSHRLLPIKPAKLLLF